jgi:hypothetical protein
VNWLRRFFGPDAVVGDLRSAAVGGLCGVLVSAVLAYGASLFDRVYEVYVSESNYAQPLINLMHDVEDEGRIVVEFQPAELAMTATCEFWRGSADTFSDIFFEFMRDYSACFSLRQMSGDSYLVAVNSRSGSMEQIGTDWVCNCS